MAPNPNLARLDALEATIADLRIEIEQLQEHAVLIPPMQQPIEATLEAMDDLPAWTERIAIDSTIKDGYRVKEATITVANAKGDDATREERRRRLAELIEDGQAVADAMNSQRDQVKRFA